MDNESENAELKHAVLQYYGKHSHIYLTVHLSFDKH